MENLLLIGWFLALVVYITLTHLYNWGARKIGTKEDTFVLHLPFTLIYLLMNLGFFKFTYLIFQQL